MSRKKQLTTPQETDATLKAECELPDLTERQHAFVDAYLANGGIQARAARTAGYLNGKNAAKWLMNTPKVVGAIRDAREEARYHRINRLQKRVELADTTVETVMQAPAHEKRGYQDHLDAVRIVYESAGLLSVHQAPQGNPSDNFDNLFRGRSIADLTYFGQHGYFPEDALDVPDSSPRTIEGAGDGVRSLPESTGGGRAAGRKPRRTE